MSHRPLEWWDRFFFEPQSTAPMTLVRVAWGAVMAVWALSLLPDIDPFFTEGALLYERDLRDGSWNLLPHLGGTGGARHVRRAAPRVVGHDGGAQDAAQRRRRRAVPRGAAARQQCHLQLRRPAPSAGRDRRRAVAVRPAVVRSTRPSTVAAAASGRSFGRRSGCGCCSSSSRWATCSRRGRRRGDDLGGRHRHRAVAAHRGPAALRGARLVAPAGARAASAHLVDPRLRGHLHRAGVAPPPPPVGAWGPGCSCTSASTSSSTSASSAWPSTSPIWPSSPPSSPSGCCAGSTSASASPLQASDPRPFSIEPAQEHGHRSGIVPEPMARPVHDPELGGAVGVDEDPRVEHGDEVVVAPVHDEQGARARGERRTTPLAGP